MSSANHQDICGRRRFSREPAPFDCPKSSRLQRPSARKDNLEGHGRTVGRLHVSARKEKISSDFSRSFISMPQAVRQPLEGSQEPPTYYFDGGLRKVKPYDYVFSTFAKQRWYGRTILEVFSTEFRQAYFAETSADRAHGSRLVR
jgi:hypothetical protein